MADLSEPKKETTRISVAPETAVKLPDSNTKSRDTVPLPAKAPLHILVEPRPGPKSPVGPISPQFFSASQPPVSLNASVMPAPDLPQSGPIKETVRIPLQAVQMKKTQPLVPMPEKVSQNPSVVTAPVKKNSTPLLWLLLGASAVILIIQIWTYLS